MLHNGKVNLSELKGDGNTTINLYQVIKNIFKEL